MKKTQILFVFLFVLLFASTVNASMPQPQSEGKYFSSKGTKSSETYESTAGMPVYEYGKGIQWGPVHIKPDVIYRPSWNDNIFYAETGKKSDIVHNVVADIKGELPFAGGQHLLTAGYRVNQEWFGRFDAQNHTDQSGRLGLKLNFVPFTLDAEDVYERTVSRSDTEFTDRIQRDENAFHSLLEVPFASFFLENEITDFNEAFDRSIDSVFDHNLFTVYQRVGYDMTPSTQLLAEYAYININYTNVGDRDGDGHQYMLGMRGNFTERIAYQAWGGAQHRIYDDAVRPDFNGFVVRGAIQWEPSEINTFVLKGDRQPQESTYDGQSFYTRNRTELTWKRQLAERWYWNTHGSVAYNEYSRITVSRSTSEEETRRDYSWAAGSGLEYKMPNDIISITLDYNFSSRESNMDGLSYEANEISAGLRASF